MCTAVTHDIVRPATVALLIHKPTKHVVTNDMGSPISTSDVFQFNSTMAAGIGAVPVTNKIYGKLSL